MRLHRLYTVFLAYANPCIDNKSGNLSVSFSKMYGLNRRLGPW